MKSKSKTLNYDSKKYKRKCNALNQQMKENGLKYALYELNDAKKEKRVTYCIAEMPSGEYIRGRSFCSSEDNYCKAVGNFYAMKRVLSARKHRRDVEFVGRQEMERFRNSATIIDTLYAPKAQWNVVPTMPESLFFKKEQAIS